MVPYTAVADLGLMYVFVSGSTLECLANILMCGISTLLNSKKPLSMVLNIVRNSKLTPQVWLELTCNRIWGLCHRHGCSPEAYASSYL